MGTNNRREVAKRLTQEIAVTKDTKTLLELSKQLAKVLPKRRRTRKPLEEPKKNLPIPDGNQVLNRVVVEIESKCKGRGGWSALTRAEKDTLLAEAKNSLSTEESAALEALDTEKAA